MFCRAAKPVCHNYSTCALRDQEMKLLSLRAATTETPVPQSLRSTRETTTIRSMHTVTREQPPCTATREGPHSNEDPAQTKSK